MSQGETGALEDLRAMRRLSALSQEHPTLINQLVGMSILALEVDTMSHLLEAHGTTYSDEVLESFEVEMELALEALTPLTLEGEYIMFDDVLQRVYSDNGSGNGIFIGESGAWLAENGSGLTGFPMAVEQRLTSLAAPFLRSGCQIEKQPASCTPTPWRRRQNIVNLPSGIDLNKKRLTVQAIPSLTCCFRPSPRRLTKSN